MACRILHGLAGGEAGPENPAYDVNAACSGYLYALRSAHDWLQVQPSRPVLIVTTEVLSQVIDPSNFETAVLFGDAASATVLYGGARAEQGRWMLRRPVLSARAESGETLRVPAIGNGFVEMQGRKTFALAVRKMGETLERACGDVGLSVADIDLIVPHQANGRIIQALARRYPSVSVFDAIQHRGNTSSSSIPQCLADLEAHGSNANHIGLCAFGGGFTFGAALLQVRRSRTERVMMGPAPYAHFYASRSFV